MNDKGKLFLIPAGLGNNDFSRIIPEYNKTIIYSLDNFIVEELRTARRFLRKIGYTKNFDNVSFNVLNEHTDTRNIYDYLNPVAEGKNIGLLSEAGVPCVADPGAAIVKIAHQKKIDIIPLIGPSSILLSLMASGFNGQNFAFLGYLPVKKPERISELKKIEKRIYQNNQTQIFIEAPYRNMQMLESIFTACDKNTLLCIAKNITLESEFIKTRTLAEWKKNPPDLNKQTTVFLLYK